MGTGWECRAVPAHRCVSGEMSSGLVLVDGQTEFRCVQGAVTQAKAVPVVTTGLAHHTDMIPQLGDVSTTPSAQGRGSLPKQVVPGGGRCVMESSQDSVTLC